MPETAELMKSIFQIFTISLLLIAGINIANSQILVLTQTNPSGIYNQKDKIEVTLTFTQPLPDSVSIKIDENYNGKSEWQKSAVTEDKMILFSGSINNPASMIFEVRFGENYAGTGLVVAPEKIKAGMNRPKDFDKYWKSEKEKLRALKMDVKSTPVAVTEPAFVCSDVEINCTGPKPARGYFAKPAKAAPGTLPIVLNLHAAGVKGDWCLAKPTIAINYAKMGKGALAFDLNAHGMLNGQPQEYYAELEKGELKNYWEIGMENRDDFYFRGMYLRLMRTLDFLCSQPEWDGKRIIVIGESQGGGQALAAAGLDHRVTAAVATVPAMCDFGRELIEETGGWPNPFGYSKNKEEMMQTIPYFDAAFLLKDSKATLITEIGLIDFTCPSLGIYAAINQASGKKMTFAVPYRGHHHNQPTFKTEWEETVYKPKMRFIEDFLK